MGTAQQVLIANSSRQNMGDRHMNASQVMQPFTSVCWERERAPPGTSLSLYILLKNFQQRRKVVKKTHIAVFVGQIAETICLSTCCEWVLAFYVGFLLLKCSLLEYSICSGFKSCSLEKQSWDRVGVLRGVGLQFLLAQSSGRPGLLGTSLISDFLFWIIPLSALQKPG